MKLGIPVSAIKFLHRYSFTIYIVVVLGGLALVILSFTNIINASSATTTVQTPDSSIPTFDQATIKKIDSLQPSGTPTHLPSYKGRTNPFSE